LGWVCASDRSSLLSSSLLSSATFHFCYLACFSTLVSNMISICSILSESIMSSKLMYDATGSPVWTSYNQFWLVHIIFLAYATATGCPWDSDGPQPTVRFFWVGSSPVSFSSLINWTFKH
jgi:hypothetical protein